MAAYCLCVTRNCPMEDVGKSFILEKFIVWVHLTLFENLSYEVNLAQNLCTLSLYECTYLLTPWSRVVLHKLTGFQLVKKFPAFYGNRKFITAFTSVWPYSEPVRSSPCSPCLTY